MLAPGSGHSASHPLPDPAPAAQADEMVTTDSDITEPAGNTRTNTQPAPAPPSACTFPPQSLPTRPPAPPSSGYYPSMVPLRQGMRASHKMISLLCSHGGQTIVLISTLERRDFPPSVPQLLCKRDRGRYDYSNCIHTGLHHIVWHRSGAGGEEGGGGCHNCCGKAPVTRLSRDHFSHM